MKCKAVLCIAVWTVSYIAAYGQQSNCVPPPENLVSWWPLDGNAFDITSTANHGTISGGVTSVTGLVDLALSFNGTDSGIVSGNTTVMNTLPLTIDAWVKPAMRNDGSNFPNNVVSNDDPSHSGHGFGVNVFATGSQLTVEYQDGFRTVPGILFTSDQWYFIATVYTPGNVKTYVNGGLVDNFDFEQQALDGANFVRIGFHNDDVLFNGTRRFFAGLIDEVEIFDRALSANELATIYNAQSAGKCKSVPVSITSVGRSPDKHVMISGESLPNAFVTLQVSSDLQDKFSKLGTANVDNTGMFDYDDSSAVPLTKQFYRAVYP